MFKIGEKRSPVWEAFYSLPKKEEEEHRRKRARLIEEIGKDWVGDNMELILPKEVWFLVRDFFRLLLREEYGENFSEVHKCRESEFKCRTQYIRSWKLHREHHIFCRDDYKLWYYHYEKERVDKKWDTDEFIMKPLTVKIQPTKIVMRHINYGRVLFMLTHL